jgi:tRNA pseudouridine38-40 synthase
MRHSTQLRLTVEYDGTEYCGFQWQPAVRSVAGVLQDALERLLREPVKITGAGRTDSGVHATGQVVSFATSRAFPIERLAVALNALLPRDCSVRDATQMDEGFSARFSARERVYVYAILNDPVRSALMERFTWHVPRPIDVEAMAAAGACLLGEHDFRAFSVPAPEPAVRNVRLLRIERLGGLVRVEIAADGFLHHMVRVIVGTLAECGEGRRDPAQPAAILASGDRSAAGITAPPQGLYLAGVRYPDGYDSYSEPPVFAGRRSPAGALDWAQAFP